MAGRLGACPGCSASLLIRRCVNVNGYTPLITHLFQEGAQYLDSDVVFGTKQELVITFTEREPGPIPDGATFDTSWLEAHYDFRLQPA